MWAVVLAGFFLYLIAYGLYGYGFFRLSLLHDEVFFGDAQAMQQSDNLSVEEPLTEGGHSDDVQAEVGTGELDLAVSELHLNRAL